MNTEKQAGRPPDGATLTYPRDIFVLAVFDHDNASRRVRGEGGSPSLPFRGKAGCSTAGHRRSCKHAGPKRQIHPSAASVSWDQSSGQQVAEKVFLHTAVKKKTTRKKTKAQRLLRYHPVKSSF